MSRIVGTLLIIFARSVGQGPDRSLLKIREPFCQPYGNRRLIKCLPLTPENERALEEAARLALAGKPVPHSLGETPAWEACGKVIAVERADYWEFV
ncbi:hypothetical protein FS837_009653, partial [Tulasnella sp. UAMH 9824]